MQFFIFLLLFLSSGVDADGTDVTNNLFSDLGPLLALFGDTFAQQFLRESFTWLNHIIFAMAPLGILTAIIGAIRVAGPGYLRAVIGRARENRASAELDFMSSTSHEVSELWNGDGIVRTMGKGKVKQIIFLKGCEQSEDLGLYTLHLAERDGLMEYERIILQVGVIIFSAFVAYNSRFGDIVGGRPSAYAFPILASGTAVLVFGMGICALVIGESTNEDIWKLKEHKDHTTEDAQGNHESASHIPKDVEAGGAQGILRSTNLYRNDFLKEGKEFVLTSCRSKDPVSGDSSDSIPRTRLDKFPQQESRSSSFTPPLSKSPQSDKSALSWLSTLCIIGTSTGVVGFVLQFEGFRGISWACSIAQLAAILIMTIVRAIIRRGMLDSPVAEKIQDGYEIDWLALRFGNKPDFLLNLSDRKSKDAVCFMRYTDKVYTTFTHIPIEKFQAQHIFSTFMWAIADLVRIASSGDKLSSQIDPPPEEEKLELDGPKPKWNILRLTHNTIKSMVKTVEATGLGSSEDAYLLIIPPLSYFYKLPNACVADLVRKKAQENKLEYRDTACARYKKLLAMCEIYSLDSMFVYSVVSTVVSFLVTTTSTSAPAQYLSYDNKQTSQRSRKDLINTLRKDYAQFLLVLKQVYVKQDRVKRFDKALPLDDDKVSKQKQKIKLEEGYTSLHLKIINKDKVDVSNLDSFKDCFRVQDILGWTPLHYAVIYSSEFALALLKNTPALANKIDLADRTPLHYAVMKQHEEGQIVAEEVIEELSNNTKPLPGREGKFPLHWAVKTCNMGAAKLLLKIKSHRDTISSKDCWDMTPLHFAALNGNLAIMRYLLEGINHTPSVLNTTDCFDRTVLHAVVMRIGSEEFLNGSIIVKELLEKGADVQRKDKDGKKALDLAAELELKFDLETEHAMRQDLVTTDNSIETKGFTDVSEMTKQQGVLNAKRKATIQIVEKLLKANPDKYIDLKNLFGRTALLLAVEKGHLDVVTKLLNHGASPDAKDLDGHTALMLATSQGTKAIVQKLMDAKAKRNIKDNNERPTFIAVKHGRYDIMKLFLEDGADPNEVNDNGDSILKNDSTQIVEQILKNETFVDAQTRSKSTALFEAVAQGHEKIVQLLLDARANVNIANDAKETPLFLAVRNSQYDILKMLLEKKPNVNLANEKHETPLSLALTYRNESVARSLLEAGANVNEMNSKGETPLLLAVDDENESMVSLLLETHWKANVDIMNYQKDTPLALAVRKRNQALTEIILQANADVNIANDSGQIPLTAAVRLENITLVKLLLKAGANVNEEDSEGETPLFRAVFAENSEIVSLLLEHNTGTKSYLTYGRTLLQEAVWWGTEEIMDSLLYHKANISERDMQGRDGRNIFHHAAVSGDTEMISYLLELPYIMSQYHKPDNNDWTPLHWAAQDGDFEVVQRLIDAGAGSVAKSKESIKRWTPQQIANYNDQWRIVDLLEPFSIPDEDLPEADLRYSISFDKTHRNHNFETSGRLNAESSNDPNSTIGNSKQEDADQVPTHNEATNAITTGNDTITPEDPVKEGMHHEGFIQEDITQKEATK
ncbi:hypothetical protein DID88_006825 [Monilinia fructigena]|uniref:Uncharacterized protein n=1 Tax=Monilinia fructigena TaxID=38457 RepID=A0A395IGK9_9HELO|nr:hypothetical protein DID88_006825 [Monilinia fructigena]